MKSYRMLIPIALVAIMALSVFSFVKDKRKLQNNYEAYISSAEYCMEESLYVDAINYYRAAYDIQPSLELDKKIIDCYVKQGNNVESLYEEMLDKYPREQLAYEYAIEYYILEKEYEEAYEIKETSQKRKINSDKIKEMFEEIQYYYKLSRTDFIEVGEYHNDYCIVKSEKEKYGITGVSGNLQLGCNYNKISSFSSDYFSIINNEGELYWIDINGDRRKNYNGEETIVELGPLTEQIFWAKLENEKYAFYNSESQKISNEYTEITNFSDGVGMVLDGSWYIVNTMMEHVNDVPYAMIITDENGYAANSGRLFVSEGTGYKMLDTSGNAVSDVLYENAKLFIDGTGAAVQQDGKWGFVNVNGEIVIEPEFEDARSFSNGFAAVKKDGKWGFIDAQNNIVIEPEFEDVRDFNSSGNCYVFKEGNWNLLSFYY